MDKVIQNVEATMAELIQKDMLVIHRKSYGVEIELRTDILFPSGSATMSPVATSVLQQLAETLKPLPYPMRVEGHTDNRPINTLTFPSNWELSAARAATVVHLFMERGIDPTRLAVIGLGEFRPIADNGTEQGRNNNRRVMVVILSNGESAEQLNEPVRPAQQESLPAVAVSEPGGISTVASAAP
jgi:chemotaxis protein MotB